MVIWIKWDPSGSEIWFWSVFERSATRDVFPLGVCGSKCFEKIRLVFKKSSSSNCEEPWRKMCFILNSWIRWKAQIPTTYTLRSSCKLSHNNISIVIFHFTVTVCLVVWFVVVSRSGQPLQQEGLLYRCSQTKHLAVVRGTAVWWARSQLGTTLTETGQQVKPGDAAEEFKNPSQLLTPNWGIFHRAKKNGG